MSCICIIPARGGSQRIPHKNIRMFHGKPIIAYSIETALASGIFDIVYVSTDSVEIAQIALRFGAVAKPRSGELARDEVGTQEVIRRIIEPMADSRIESVCCLYPCAPMLKPETLRKAKELLTPETPYVVPVATWLRDPGQFYFGHVAAFGFGAALNSAGTKLLWIDSATECDINTEEDWLRAERMYAALQENQS